MAAAKLVAALAVCAVLSTLGAGPSEQVHLSVVGKEGIMHVAFAVDNWRCAATDKRAVRYGTEAAKLTQTVYATGFAYTAGMKKPVCLFDGDMTGLAANTRYFYTVEGNAEVYSFVNAPAREGGNVYAVFGDMGAANDVSASQLVAEAKGGVFDMILYSGDYAYDFPSYGGDVGNEFMRILAPVAGRAPWMGVVGNHERANNFSHWRSRFFGYKQVAAASGSTNPLWYPFNHGLVHFVCISSEVYSFGGGSAADQHAWLAKDLQSVDRSATPWVIALAHKDPWMDSTDYSVLDPLFRKFHVDLLLVGHAHNYQRIVPNTSPDKKTQPEACFNSDKSVYTDCASYMTVVAGSPGNWEVEAEPDTTLAPSQILHKVSLQYGYAHLTVVNATTLLYQWEETKQRDLTTGQFVARAGAFFDTFQITKKR